VPPVHVRSTPARCAPTSDGQTMLLSSSRG
jgi:hypothetical protein